MPLPPLWALGYHQCRYSYYPESKVRFIADNFRERQDSRRRDLARHPLPWTATSRSRGTRSASRIRGGCRRPAQARVSGPCTIVDPHPKKETGYAPYDTGLAGDHFVKNRGRHGLRGAGLAVAGGEEPAARACSRTSASRQRATWWGGLYQIAARRRRRRHLERHERAGGLRRRRPARCRSTSVTTTKASRRTIARFTTSTAC